MNQEKKIKNLNSHSDEVLIDNVYEVFYGDKIFYDRVKNSKLYGSHIDATIKNQFKSDKACFRKLIGNMINDNSAWAERNRAKMVIDYLDYIHSAYEYCNGEFARRTKQTPQIVRNVL
ncbi:hypothetical protein BpHYR1_028820 [Brachionus plicatilis]|uniref:Uncharacterized protein n=1 Tax=Brachionus plicatilis TaxID=10195 RepID=A0A3M7SDF7_BRAPC|nr:hypothetical protein BpHYR1_028820 [Brachionus plicatilis]